MSSAIAYEQLNRQRNWLTDFGGDKSGTSYSDDAMARALDWLADNDEQEIFIPRGNFKFADEITLPPGARLRGCGWNSRLIKESSGTCVRYNDETHLESLSIYGNESGVVNNSSGLSPGSTDPTDYDRICTIRNVLVRYFDNGITFGWQGVLSIYDPYIRGCNNGLRVSGRQNNAINVYAGEIRECINGILSDETSGIAQNFWGVTVEGNHQYGYKNTQNGSSLVNFDGCYFEDNDDVTGTGADIYAAIGGGLNNFRINTCYFNNTHTGIELHAAVCGKITNNLFNANTKSIVLGLLSRYIEVDHLNRYSGGAAIFDPTVDDTGDLNTVSTHPGQYGARGDGDITHDDTAELQAWLLHNPVLADLPKGTYLISDTLVIADGQHLRGQGRASTVLKPAVGFAGPLVTLGTDATISGIELLGITEAGSVGIKPASGAARWRILDCYWTLFGTGVLVDSVAPDGLIRDCRGFNCLTAGLLVSANASGLKLDEVRISACPRNIQITGAVQDMKIWGGRNASASVYGLDVTGGTLGLSVIGVLFDNNTTADIALRTVSQLATLIQGCRCITTPISVLVEVADRTVIRGNSLGGTTAPISITGVTAFRTEIGENDYTVVDFDYSTMNSGFATSLRGRIYRSGTPDGTGPWYQGEFVHHSNPVSGSPSGWVCTVGHASSATFIAGPTIP